VAAFARERGLEVVQPTGLTPDVVERIAAARPDVVCVAAFGMILPAELLRVPRYGCINVHASLLPRHRGAAPVQRAILADDETTGVSIMLMEEGLDTGPYALQRPVPIAGRYAVELEEELAFVGARALLDVLDQVAGGTVLWTPQDDSKATYAPKVTKDDVALTPELTAHQAMLRVRAATRSAPARACVGEKELTVVRAHVRSGEFAPGSVCLIDGEPVLGFADGALAL
jgi:methionyl-tRNA formyltransferase